MSGSWLESYGYWAVLIGGMLEGEAVFIAAGYAISGEHLRPLPAFVAAVAGGCLGDLAYYAIGRVYGARLMRRLPVLRKLRARAVLFVRRWGRATAAMTRFAYGMRTIVPMSIGMARLSLPVFLLFNLLGSLAFAGFYLSLGYLFGETLEEALGAVKSFQRPILLGILLLGAAAWAVREWRLVRLGAAAEEAGEGSPPAPERPLSRR